MRKKYVDEHLEGITAEVLISFKEEAFTRLATCGGITGGTHSLGVAGNGKFGVQTKNEKTLFFDGAQDAIDHYRERLLNE